MISIDDGSRALPAGLLDQPGGFAWWYFDHVAEDGTSVVVIPSFGLPFLPGHASRARAGNPIAARALPSLNVAVVHRDRPAFYLLQQVEAADATWSDEELRIGASRFRSALEGGRRMFHAELDCPLPGTTDRLRGTLRLDAPAIRLADRDGGAPHLWTPLAVGPAAVDLAVGDTPLARGPGRAYHDRNGCDRPLHTLGIHHWWWGRVAFPDGELVTYALWPEGGAAPTVHAWWIHPDGRSEAAGNAVELEGPRLGWYGMPWWRRLRFGFAGDRGFELTVRAVVDDGPFYLRFHTEVRRDDGSVGRGVAEAVRPGRVDLAPLRPLVRMAVHHPTGANSFWLPLFSGLRAGRWGRLFGRRAPALLGSPS